MLISSIDEYSGKSGFIMALGLILKEKGYKVGYFKPIGMGKYIGDRLVDEDALAVAETLKLDESIDEICPVIVDKPYVEFIISTDHIKLKRNILEAFERVKQDKDILLVEGSFHYELGRALGLCDMSMVSLLDLNDLMIVKFTDDSVIDKLLSAKSKFGEKLKMAIFNQVSGYKRSYLESLAESLLRKNGIEIVGMIPKDSLLAGVFLSEITSALGGRYLVKPEKDCIIEQLLVGAMSPQSALEYFRKARNCAIITGGDRSDLIMLALEIPNVRCLILTGNLEPPSIVIGKAEEKEIPMVVVPEDTLTTVEKIESIFGKVRIRGEEKIKRIRELVESFVNLDRLMEYIGL